MGENKTGKIHSDNAVRPALGDISNLVNRGTPLVTRSPPSKKLSGSKRAAENIDDDTHFWNQVSLVVEKIEKERSGLAKCPKVAHNEVGLSPLKGGKTYRLQSGSGSVDGNGGKIARDDVVESKEPSSSALDGIDLGEDENLVNVINLDDKDKEGGILSGCCEKNSLEVGKECLGDERISLSDVEESYSNPTVLATEVPINFGKIVGGDCMTSSMSDYSFGTSKFTESQETRPFGLERCTLVKGDGSNSGVDLLKTCTCSFCTKAAYIWSDLQCQDVKGRISTLAKSQKEASNLAQRYSIETGMSDSQGNSSTTPLQPDLTKLWKSLFLHMDNIYAAESSQLQSNFGVLKEAREEYKMNLEKINVMPPEMQQSSSDASDPL